VAASGDYVSWRAARRPGASDSGPPMSTMSAARIAADFHHPSPARAISSAMPWRSAATGWSSFALRRCGAGDSGAVHLFNLRTGLLQRTLSNPTPAGSDNFGLSVAVSQDRLLAEHSATTCGRQCRQRLSVRLQTEIFSDDDEDGSGRGINSAGRWPSPRTWRWWERSRMTRGPTGPGCLLVRRADRAFLRALNNPTPAASDNFGYSVALVGDRRSSGAVRRCPAVQDAGRSYLFDTETGQQLLTLANGRRLVLRSVRLRRRGAGRRSWSACPSRSGRPVRYGAHAFDVKTGDSSRPC